MLAQLKWFWALLFIASAWLGCGRTATPQDHPLAAEPANAAAQKPPPPSRLAECDASSKAALRLNSYRDVEVPGRYAVELGFASGRWQPPRALPQPRHHATRLGLTNLADYPALALHQNQRVQFTIQILGREVHKVPDRAEWRSTYRARILAACVLGASDGGG